MAGITRRDLIGGAAGAVVLIALGGGAKMAYGFDERLLRPPGGQDEAHFLATCIRCDRCLTVCPTEVISLANLDHGIVNARTPYLDFRQGYCTFCDGEYRCIANCPTGALLPFDCSKEKIGVAVVSTDLCISYGAAGGCRVCADACEYEAITLDDRGRPTVNADLCNGCGACEEVCPSNVYRDFATSGDRGINVELANGGE